MPKQITAKKAAAEAAALLVQKGMRIGLGSGSTTAYFIEAIGIRCKEESLSIQAIATSQASYELAKRYQIPMLDVESVTKLDLTVDGADEIDPQKRMIKGGGGALLREKIVATMSDEMVVIVDSSKRVEALGTFPLPLELVPFAIQATLAHLEKLGYRGSLRTLPDGTRYVTDNGNYICDLQLSFPCRTPEEDQRKICTIPGVIETGFFFDLAGRVITGFPDGSVKIEE